MAIFKLFSQEVNSFVSSLQFVPRALKSALSEDGDYFSSGEESERSSSPESHCEVRAEGKMFPQSLKSLFSKKENKANAQEGRTGVQPLGSNPWGPTPGDQPLGSSPMPKRAELGTNPMPKRAKPGSQPMLLLLQLLQLLLLQRRRKKKEDMKTTYTLGALWV